jgi:hypothetical protein
MMTRGPSKSSSALKVYIGRAVEEGRPAVKPVSVQIDASTDIDGLYKRTAPQLGVQESVMDQYCLVIADKNIVVTNFKVLANFQPQELMITSIAKVAFDTVNELESIS